MTIIEQIKAEIERRQKENYEQEGSFAAGRVVEDADILSFLSTLESEKPMQEELDKEIGKIWETCEPVDEGMGVETANIHIEQFDYLARHFAQWGAEHLADARKTSPNDLEEAAQESATQYYIDAGYSPFPNVETAAHKSGFIAGAKWMKEQMLKDGLDAVKTCDFNKVEKTIAGIFVDYGMRRQKEQLMEKAVEGYIERDCGGQLILGRENSPAGDEFMLLDGFLFPEIRAGEKYRVRIIIVKED